MNALPRYNDFDVPASSVATRPTSGVYRPSAEDYVAKFYKLSRRLTKETAVSSNPMDYVRNPAFGEIIDLGDKVIPLIIASLQARPSHLVLALPILTGTDVVTPEVRGKLGEIVNRWIEWYNRRGEFI